MRACSQWATHVATGRQPPAALSWAIATDWDRITPCHNTRIGMRFTPVNAAIRRQAVVQVGSTASELRNSIVGDTRQQAVSHRVSESVIEADSTRVAIARPQLGDGSSVLLAGLGTV